MDIKWFICGFVACPLSTSVLFGLWVVYCTWQNDRQTKRQTQAKLEQRISEPLPLSPKVLEEISVILGGSRLNDDDIDEMQMRGW